MKCFLYPAIITIKTENELFFMYYASVESTQYNHEKISFIVDGL